MLSPLDFGCLEFDAHCTRRKFDQHNIAQYFIIFREMTPLARVYRKVLFKPPTKYTPHKTLVQNVRAMYVITFVRSQHDAPLDKLCLFKRQRHRTTSLGLAQIRTHANTSKPTHKEHTSSLCLENATIIPYFATINPPAPQSPPKNAIIPTNSTTQHVAHKSNICLGIGASLRSVFMLDAPITATPLLCVTDLCSYILTLFGSI